MTEAMRRLGRAEVIAGFVWSRLAGRSRPFDYVEVVDQLRSELSPSAVWLSADLPPDLRGPQAFGRLLPLWEAPDDLESEEYELFERAWDEARPPLDNGDRRHLRVMVSTADDVEILRAVGEIDGLTIVPTLLSDGSDFRPVQWRWPFRVGVVGDRDDWLVTIRSSDDHGRVFDAEPFDLDADYDIAIVHGDDIGTLPQDVVDRLGRVACVIAADAGPVDEVLDALQDRIAPLIAIAVAAPPDDWWNPFYWELSHDVPIDASIETYHRTSDVDLLIAGPRGDPVAFVPSATRSVVGSVVVDGVHEEEKEEEEEEEEGAEPEIEDEQAPAAVGRRARRMIARVWHGRGQVEAVLPPNTELLFGVRIAIPERLDTAADVDAPIPDAASSPTIQLEVVACSDAWPKQPAPQPISLSIAKPTQPSTWARFPITTPGDGIVEIEIMIMYRGKPLQAATYVSPVTAAPVPGEVPTLTTFSVSGPDEPLEEESPIVDATLDGRGAELHHLRGGAAKVLITEVDDMLKRIEEQVSRVLGVPGAPDSFADERAVELLVDLARLGSELNLILAPLKLTSAERINLIVNAETHVLPLELVYTGQAPRRGAKLCKHAAQPPPMGKSCTRTSTRTVCPYAFWGLHRSIARSIVADGEPRGSDQRPLSATTVLYAATDIADVGARRPTPSVSVRTAAEALFPNVHQVSSWRAWRRAIEDDHPDLLVVLGHTMTEAGETKLYIGRRSVLARPDISVNDLRSDGAPAPLVLLMACASVALGDAFGSLPGIMTARGAGAVVGTLSKIVGPHGATAATHLLRAVHETAGTTGTIGSALTSARRSLVAEQRPIGLILVSHGELDTRVVP